MSLVDHHDRPCRAPTPFVIGLLLSTDAGAIAQRQCLYACRRSPAMRPFWFVVHTLGNAAVIALVFMAIYGVPMLYVAAGAIAVVAAYCVLMAALPRWAWRTWVREMIWRGRCPSCGHTLVGLTADAEGVTTCPGCGVGWIPHDRPKA